MKIVIISDTHGRHEELGILRGDVLVHCGDCCNGYQRDPDDIQRLDEWFGRQECDRIFCVGGNHDFFIQERAERKEAIFKNAVYLQDQLCEYRGVRFYGSPWTRYEEVHAALEEPGVVLPKPSWIQKLGGWAFFLNADGMRAKWALIPERTDVLITHAPPFGILDLSFSGKHSGCPDLQRRVMDIRPRLHCFGHKHAGAGTLDLDGTTYMNASIVNDMYEVTRKPLEFDF